MRNIFLKTVTTVLVMLTPLEADIAYTNALFGVEASYSELANEYRPDSGIKTRGTNDFLGIGIKAGAETKTLRTFFSLNYYNDSSSLYEYLITYGGEVQYKFLRSNAYDIYAGLNAGYCQLKVNIDGESFYRTINNPYFGVSLGTNVHLSNSIDLELGARINTINTENIKSQTTFKVDSLVSGYVSFIYKWKMN
ncbi:hypothetical protein JHD47_02270 [Sulfurimonas sp. SAG-AH-194-L11]|nr:outer membrane beta-barrel protein [Sulfurimonas sp. SAG-AH-194-L11]MDF1876638.1 hypothetical protein [Sulfurimonas sp. SAG-AH-194-L11]